MPEEKKLGEVEVLFERDDCPECGGKSFAYKDTADMELAAGRVTEQQTKMGFGLLSVQPLVDPAKIGLTAPQITEIKDICLSCGAEFVRKVIRVRVQLTIQTQRPSGPDLPGFMKRGGRF
jgi:hypothetical protein